MGTFRFLIIGGGPIGLSSAARLARGDNQVCLVVRPEQVEAISKYGIKLTGYRGEYLVETHEVYGSAEEVPEQRFDAILIAVKAYDTRVAASSCRRFAGPDSAVVSLQNGLGNLETIAEATSADHILGATIMFGAKLVGTGAVDVTAPAEPLVIGALDCDRSGDMAEVISESLRNAGIETTTVGNINDRLWCKALFNAAVNPLAALESGVSECEDCSLGTLASDGELVEVMNQIIEEVFWVARCHGISLPWESPDEYKDHFYEDLIPTVSGHRPSMIKDVRAGKRTEIDALNGYIVKLGRRYGVDVSQNRAIVAALKRKARFFRRAIKSLSAGNPTEKVPITPHWQAR